MWFNFNERAFFSSYYYNIQIKTNFIPILLYTYLFEVSIFALNVLILVNFSDLNA